MGAIWSTALLMSILTETTEVKENKNPWQHNDCVKSCMHSTMV